MLQVKTSYGTKTSYSDIKIPLGSQRANSKLTEFDALSIRSKHASGLFSISTLARIYKVSGTTIQKVTSGKTWKHVTQKAPVALN